MRAGEEWGAVEGWSPGVAGGGGNARRGRRGERGREDGQSEMWYTIRADGDRHMGVYRAKGVVGREREKDRRARMSRSGRT